MTAKVQNNSNSRDSQEAESPPSANDIPHSLSDSNNRDSQEAKPLPRLNILPQSHSNEERLINFLPITDELYGLRRHSASAVYSERINTKTSFGDFDAPPITASNPEISKYFDHKNEFNRRASEDVSSPKLRWQDQLKSFSSPLTKGSPQARRRAIDLSSTIKTGIATLPIYSTHNDQDITPNQVTESSTSGTNLASQNLNNFQSSVEQAKSKVNSHTPELLQSPDFKYKDAIKITCHRTATKDEKLNIQAGWYNVTDNSSNSEKIYVATNLGHSGSGFTVGYGTVLHSVDEFIKQIKNDEKLREYILKNGIGVVGAGVIGTMTAVLLDEKINCSPEIRQILYGSSSSSNNNEDNKKKINITVYYNELKNLPSYHAGGLLAVTKLAGQNDEEEAQLKNLTLITYKFFQDCIDKVSNIFNLREGSVKNISAFFHPNTDQGMAFYKNADYAPSQQADIEFEKIKLEGLNKYDKAIFLQVSEVMDDLRSEAKRRKITFEEKTVTDFLKLKEKVIFGCSGLGRVDGYKNDIKVDEKYLHEDAAPITGHMLLANIEQKIDYVYIADIKIKNPKGEFIQRLQIMPKEMRDENGKIISNCMIGGTFKKLQQMLEERANGFDNHKFIYELFNCWKHHSPKMESAEFKDYTVEVLGTKIEQVNSFTDALAREKESNNNNFGSRC